MHVPNNFIIETVGSTASDETKLGVYLDTIARWIYTEKLRQEKK